MSDVCKEEIFNSIYRKVSEELHRFVYHRFGPGNNPPDIVQEAFLKLWDNCKKVTPENARAFLYKVARNFTLNQIAKINTERRNADYDDTSGTYSPQEIMEENEFNQKLQLVLESLPEKQKEAFMLNKVEGLKHREIAEMLGISQKAVEKRIYKAAATVFKQLGRKI